MSVLLLLVVAIPAEAPAVVAAEEPESHWATRPVGVADEINLAALWALLDDRPYDVDDVLKFKTIATHKDGSTWVVFVPEPLTDRLAKLSESQLGDVAARWVEMPSVKERRFYEPAFRQGLADLRQLAIQARAKQKALLVRVTV
jgi:hypothetical protein